MSKLIALLIAAMVGMPARAPEPVIVDAHFPMEVRVMENGSTENVIVMARAGGTINGAASYTIRPGERVKVITEETSSWVVPQ